MTVLPGRRALAADLAYDFGVGRIGDPGTWLLAGPSHVEGTEPLAGHLARLGPLPGLADPAGVLAAIHAGGLQGRGGGGFPVAEKLRTALTAPGRPLVVVNASESEPASRKDRTLCTLRPHLVLDGAAAAAAVVGADEVVVHAHRGSASALEALRGAIGERLAASLPDPRWRLSVGPDRYVAGEASAIASLLSDGEARPRFSGQPMAVRGPSGRPTLVHNAETMAQLGLLLRIGPERWRSAGAPSSPGPWLFTLAGGVDTPGQVVELVGRATVGEVLTWAGMAAPPAAVLVGGYAGTWVDGSVAWQTPLDRVALDCVGASVGCGLLGVLPHGACGLVETARLATYLAGESAGQCGPCVLGLPALADLVADLGRGDLGRWGLRRVRRLVGDLPGSGACSHPDGAARLVRSALEVFDDDVVRHLAGRPCRASDHPPVFPVPAVDLSEGWS